MRLEAVQREMVLVLSMSKASVGMFKSASYKDDVDGYHPDTIVTSR